MDKLNGCIFRLNMLTERIKNGNKEYDDNKGNK